RRAAIALEARTARLALARPLSYDLTTSLQSCSAGYVRCRLAAGDARSSAAASCLKKINLSKVSVRTPRPGVRLRRVSRGSPADAYEARHDGAPPAPPGLAEEWDELPGAGIQITLGGLDQAAIDFRQRRGILNHPGGDRIDGGGLRGGSFLLGGGE